MLKFEDIEEYGDFLILDRSPTVVIRGESASLQFHFNENHEMTYCTIMSRLSGFVRLDPIARKQDFLCLVKIIKGEKT